MGDISSLKKIESGQEVVRPFSAYNLKRNDEILSTNNAPFLYRPIPPLSTPYIREKLVGASVAWNQLVDTTDTSVTVTSGHKYALYKNSAWSVGISDGTAISVTGGTDMCIDLTLAFGSAIADRIYSMEQAQAGSGIAWIKSYGFLTDDYYAYGSGIQSVCADRKVVTGFNLWDEEWEVGYYGDDGEAVTSSTMIRSKNYINVTQQSYYLRCVISGVSFAICWYDGSKSFIQRNEYTRNTIQTPPNNARYMRFNLNPNYGTTYNHDICINVSSTEKNGQYEPYHQTTISLGHDELRGVPKLDANNNLYYDGDEKTADGTVTRRYGIVDLGSLDWNDTSITGYFFADAPNDSFAVVAPPVTGNAICDKYIYFTGSVGSGAVNVPDKNFLMNNLSSANVKRINVKDSAYADASTFKTAMSGVYLVYELATPTTSQSTPFTFPQYLFDGGTEEFVDYPYEQETRDVAVPVGHVTEYLGAGSDIKDKFYLPALPDADGEYKLTAKIQNGVLVEAKWDNENLIDDTTKTEFKLGIDNGLLYIEEV